MFLHRLHRKKLFQSWKGLSGIALVLLIAATGRAEETANALITRARDEFSRGRHEAAIELVTRAIKTEPKNARGYFVRARIYEQTKQATNALSDYDQVLKLDPSFADAWQARGVLRFKLAKIGDSISDFDQYLKLNPAQVPYHWQRGISYYYAERFEDGRKQFESHQTVNPNDVENAVWHFLCLARAQGVAKARDSLIPIREDGRVPMMQIHALFAGKAKPADVLQAARAGAPEDAELRQRLFYAHLYLGLYEEALGNVSEAREHIAKAASEYAGADYMSEVARVHQKLRASTGPK